MSDRIQKMSDDELDAVSGGNLTYTWFGGQGTCGLNNDNKFKFADKALFESTMNHCFQELGWDDIQTLTYMYNNGIIYQ